MYIVTKATPADLDFIRDSWRKSYRKSPGTHSWPDAAYEIWISDRLEKLIPECNISVARPHDWPEGILGWIASQQTSKHYRLLWAFTKGPFRRQQVFSTLLASQNPLGAPVYSSKSFHSATPFIINKFGFRFSP